MAHEEIARKKRFDKEQKLVEFQNKTKANAMRQLRDKKEQGQKDTNMKSIKAKENALKAKEFAQKQRMVVRSGGVNAAKKLEDAEKKKEKELQSEYEQSKFHKDIVTQNHLSSIVNITKDENQNQTNIGKPDQKSSKPMMSHKPTYKMEKGDKSFQKNNVIIEEDEDENESMSQS